MTSLLSVEVISKEGLSGILAAHDFASSVKDESYIITYPGSLELLQKFALIDNKKVHRSIRDAILNDPDAKAYIFSLIAG